MSRTPKRDFTKLPIWVRTHIADLEDRLALALEERDEAYGFCDNFEWLLERLTKQLEACETKRHEDTPNTLCANRECCPLPDGVQRPIQDARAGVRSDPPLFDSYARRLPSR